MSIKECRIIEFPKIHDTRGNLTFIESNKTIPYKVQRVYYLYDIPSGETRAGHAHKALKQVLIAISGSFDVYLDDGTSKKKYHLNRPNYGLYITPLVWRVIKNFSSGAVCLSIVSEYYDESDYIRKYEDFKRKMEN